MHLIGKLDRLLAKAEEILLAVLLVSMVLLAATQVLLRNIWNTAIDWADVSLQYATLVVGLLGAAIATSEGRHLNIDVLSRAFRGRARFGLRVAIGLFAVAVCWYLTRGGWTTFRANFEPWLARVPQGWTPSRLLRQELVEGTFPQWLAQAPLAAGFALVGVHFLLRLVRDIGALISGQPWDDARAGGVEGEAALDELEAHAGAGQGEQSAEARGREEDPR